MRVIMAFAALTALVVASAEAQEAPPRPKTQLPTQRSSTFAAAVWRRCSLSAARRQTSRPFAETRPPRTTCYASTGPTVSESATRWSKLAFSGQDWKGPIRGIKIGDSREDVVKVLGAASITFKDKDGNITAYGYELKELDAKFFANFDKDGKVWRVEVSLI